MADRASRIAVVVLRDSTAFVPVGVAELLKKALTLRDPGSPRVDVLLVGETAKVRTTGGWPVQCDTTFSALRRCDLVVVPALDPDVVEHLALNRAAVQWVGAMYRAGADVASACTGAFVLAEAGLLDGRKATTHWAYQALLRDRYPRIDVEPQGILVDQGRVCTAGGATSFINLALYLVERRLGSQLAFAASKMFLVDPNKAPQGAYAIFASQRDHGDDEILRAQDLVERAPGRMHAVAELARKVGMSGRTFVRRFKQATGNAPLEYIQRVRIEIAKRALEDSRKSLQAIAEQAGYRDPVAFRKVFARLTGLTPADYRKRYGPLAEPGVIVRRTPSRVRAAKRGRATPAARGRGER